MGKIRRAKQTTVRSETREVFTVRTGMREYRRLDCDKCGKLTDFLSIDNAVVRFGIKTMDLFRAIELESIHFAESAGGQIFICQPSLVDLSSDNSNPVTTIQEKSL
jgi:hypothetical protein